ncbi:uncharacterized protein LOC141628005 [Silene latifolia]|uniref:uncharacterized protein LOC141628005 n=1 Tax=Silene latifolia TaxID=37657 RepID=UPI003D77BAB5
MLQEINHTFITLIPKVDIPQNVTQFRHISCCNILYKAISKILCTRVSAVLPDLINKAQGGLIKGRSIVENILICEDLMLKALNFPGKTMELIMTCVRSKSYSLVLNGENFGYFKGAKGLRQGDPISPLLFTISMDYLSRILNHVTSIMPFKYHPLCAQMQLTHLMFADDLLLFSKGDIPSVMVLLSEGVLPFKYLGVPISAGKLSIKHCYGLIEKITERIRGFAARVLSYAGRLTLVNLVLTSLYSYWATIFVIPKGYTTTSGYCWIRHSQPVVTWDKAVWNSWCISKNSFINWLIAREALLLKDKLLQIGVVADSACCICGADTESHRHLFVQCQHTQKLVKLLSCKLNVKLPAVYLITWIQSKPWAKVKKNVIIAWIQALYYAIWHQRNKSRLEGVLDQPEVVLKQISSMLLMRSIFWLKCIKKSSDETWVKSINY